jgi:hypothetical protein
MLVRSWIPSRLVRDADFACRLPPRAMRGRLGAILAAHVDDGAAFDADRFRIDTQSAESIKLFAAGEVDGELAEMTVDIAFVDVWPAAARSALPFARGTARLWLCPYEMVVGTKLAVIAELGPREWRPKDLADIWLALRRFPRGASLGEAIERRIERHELQMILTRSWWRERRAETRWGRYVARAAVPSELASVIAEVRAKLSPFLRQP